MLSFPPAVRIWLATPPTDLRKSFDTLAEMVSANIWPTIPCRATSSSSAANAAIASNCFIGMKTDL